MGSSFKSEFVQNVTEYIQLMNIEAYVDKTLFIEEILKANSSRLLLTAPRKFGKTSSIKMLQAFLEIAIDTKGNIIEKEPIEYRHNYEIFKDKLIMKNNQIDGLNVSREEFINKHMGGYPVLFCDFKCKDYIGDFNDAVLFYKKVIHKIFQKYSWLVEDEKLTDDERMKCKLWCDPLQFKNKISIIDVLYGFEFISSLLNKHFDKKITLLIDDYDSLIVNAMFCVLEPDLLDIVHFTFSMLIRILKNVHTIERIIITGTTNLLNIEKYKINFQMFDFLGCHPFVQFYGLTNDEYQQLNVRFPIDKYQKYRYRTRDGVGYIYPFRSYINQDIRKFYEESVIIQKLVDVFQVREIRCKIMSLLRADSVPFELIHSINIEQLLTLRNQLLFPDCPEWTKANTFINFLLQQGYLTYMPLTERFNEIALANEDIISLFKEKLNEFIYSRCHFESNLLKNCGEMFSKLPTMLSYKHLNNLQENLEYILARAWLNRSTHMFDENLLQLVVFFSVYEYGFSYCTEINADRQFNILTIDKNSKFACIFEFKKFIADTNDYEAKISSTACGALNYIIEKRYYEIVKNEKLFNENIENFLFIGMSLDDKNGLSICCLHKGDDLSKAMHVGVQGQCLLNKHVHV